jgi:hypothetical protein
MPRHGHRATLLSCRNRQPTRDTTSRLDRAKGNNGMDDHDELTPEQASRMTVTAVTADLEYWARTASVDGRVGLNDLTRTLDLIREASTPESSFAW